MSKNIFKLKLIDNNKKRCRKCWSFKPLSDFGTSQKRFQCKSCFSAWKKEYYQRPEVKVKERQHFLKGYFKRAYGITLDQYEEMLLKQNGCCAICKNKESRVNPKSKKVQPLSVDHCHQTGKVRGLLCSQCNLILGKFNDNILLFQACIDYLQNN